MNDIVFTIAVITPFAFSLKHQWCGNRAKQHGWYVVTWSAVCTGSAITGEQFVASVAAGMVAVHIWLWWKSGGGGDGARRLLRKWARAFRGVRRTAPAGGAA